MALTKQDLEAIEGIISKQVAPVDTKVGSLRQEIQGEFAMVHQDIKEVISDIAALREQIQQLTITLDKFLKRLTDHEEEFTILKSEMKQVKQVLKEKLGIDFKGATNW